MIPRVLIVKSIYIQHICCVYHLLPRILKKQEDCLNPEESSSISSRNVVSSYKHTRYHNPDDHNLPKAKSKLSLYCNITP